MLPTCDVTRFNVSQCKKIQHGRGVNKVYGDPFRIVGIVVSPAGGKTTSYAIMRHTSPHTAVADETDDTVKKWVYFGVQISHRLAPITIT